MASALAASDRMLSIMPLKVRAIWPISSLAFTGTWARTSPNESALVALVTVALSLFTALASFQILQRQLDERLQNAVSRPIGNNGGTTTPAGADDEQKGPADPGGSGLIRLERLPQSGEYVPVSVPDELTSDGLTTLLNLEPTKNPQTIAIPGAGLYRVLVQERDRADESQVLDVIASRARAVIEKGKPAGVRIRDEERL